MILKKLNKEARAVFYILFSFFLVAKNVLAEQPGALVPGSTENTTQYKSGDYGLNDFVVIFVTVAKWILFISGALSLLAFIVGGFMFIFSAGNKEWVEKGKSAIVASVIGLVVVFSAYMIIDYFLQNIGFNEKSFGGDWNVTPN